MKSFNMIIRRSLLFVALCNIYLSPKVAGVKYFARIGRDRQDKDVSLQHAPESISDSRVHLYFHENEPTSKTVSPGDKSSGNLMLNTTEPSNSYVSEDRISAFNLGTWKIFSESTESSLEQRIKDPYVRKCTGSSNQGRPECLRKIKRKKMLKERNNANVKMIQDINFIAKATVRLPNNSLTSGNVHVDADKFSKKVGSNSCSCNWTQEQCGCDCKGTLNYDEFQDISRSFFSCNNFTFTMADGEFYALPPNFFSKVKNVQDFNLYITNSTFDYICDPTPLTSPFKGVMFEKSAHIKLTNVNVRRGWNWKPFEQLNSSSGAQVNVTLVNCQLRRLSSDFANLAGGHVDTIDIYNSDLEMVGSNAFKTFENMTRFRVPSNKIRQLWRTDFPELLFNLEELDLRNNELSYLDSDLFTNMPSLKEIVLSGNPISVLPETTFQAVIGRAELVGLSDIPLTCDCRLQWLKKSVKHNNRTERNMKGAICKRPPYLRGMPFDFLSKEHLICS